MLKKIGSIILVVFISLGLKAQGNFSLPLDAYSNTYTYQDVVEYKNMPASDIYIGVKNWIDSGVKDLQVNNYDENTFTVEGVVKFPYELKRVFYNFTANLKIECKDDKLRYTFNNFKKLSAPSSPGKSFEQFVIDYKPKPSQTNTKSIEQHAKELDDIEMFIDQKVQDHIKMIKYFVKQKQKGSDDW